MREAKSPEDLVRRLQTTVLSPQALINAWYLKNPPWKQWDIDANIAGDFAPGWEEVQALCRGVLEFRMALIPYLYTAFAAYREKGIPPFRPLVCDYPDDPGTYGEDQSYLIGDRLLAAPMVAGQASRSVYLPEGVWRDFWTGEAHEGQRSIMYDCPLERVPLFIKDGSLMPMARPVPHTGEPGLNDITVRIYGDGSLPCELYEDDGHSLAYRDGASARLCISYDNGSGVGMAERTGDAGQGRYRIVEWSRV